MSELLKKIITIKKILNQITSSEAIVNKVKSFFIYDDNS